MMLAAAAMMLFFQATPQPADTAAPRPAATASPEIEALPSDCLDYEDDPNACALDANKAAAESACIRAAKNQERCAKLATGFVHYAALMRAGSLWAVAASWLGHHTPRGRGYMERFRQIYVQLASDANVPETIRESAQKLLRGLYGTDRPTPTTPLVIDRRGR